jgi:hypothetical protein
MVYDLYWMAKNDLGPYNSIYYPIYYLSWRYSNVLTARLWFSEPASFAFVCVLAELVIPVQNQNSK